MKGTAWRGQVGSIGGAVMAPAIWLLCGGTGRETRAHRLRHTSPLLAFWKPDVQMLLWS